MKSAEVGSFFSGQYLSNLDPWNFTAASVDFYMDRSAVNKTNNSNDNKSASNISKEENQINLPQDVVMDYFWP